MADEDSRGGTNLELAKEIQVSLGKGEGGHSRLRDESLDIGLCGGRAGGQLGPHLAVTPFEFTVKVGLGRDRAGQAEGKENNNQNNYRLQSVFLSTDRHCRYRY